MDKANLKRNTNLIDYFFENRKTISNLTKEELSDLIEFISYLISQETSELFLSKELTILYHTTYSPLLSLQELWEIYWILSSRLFTNISISITDGSISNLYNRIYDLVDTMIEKKFDKIPLKLRNQNIVIVTTNQFLSEEHAPTRRVLDYSYAIQKELNTKVIIINNSGLNYQKNKIIHKGTSFYFIDQYSYIDFIEYKDEKFEFFQVNTLMPNLDTIKILLDTIYEINPLFIFNIGASCLVTDLCTNFTTTACLPCSFEIPVSRSQYLLVGRMLDERDTLRINTLYSKQRIIETKLNYNIEETIRSYKREQFGLEDEEFVISIVGNRLDIEMDIDFLTLLKDVVKNTDIHILFIGGIFNKERITEHIGCHDKIHYADTVAEGRAVTKLTNLYLNPNRNGGGRSSCEALCHGIPVVTLSSGDVFYTVGQDFAVESYEEMYSTIIRYYTDNSFYKEMQEKGFHRYKDLSDISSTQKKIIDTIIKMEGNLQ